MSEMPDTRQIIPNTKIAVAEIRLNTGWRGLYFMAYQRLRTKISRIARERQHNHVARFPENIPESAAHGNECARPTESVHRSHRRQEVAESGAYGNEALLFSAGYLVRQLVPAQ